MSTAGWNALETGQSRKYSAKKSLTAQFQELNAPKEGILSFLNCLQILIVLLSAVKML